VSFREGLFKIAVLVLFALRVGPSPPSRGHVSLRVGVINCTAGLSAGKLCSGMFVTYCVLCGGQTVPW
jgi:hypothetical protein